MDYLEEVRVWLETRKYWAEKGILRHDEMENLNKQSIEIINFILAELDGPSKEERQNLLWHFYGHLVGWHDRATCPKCLEIEALILGHAREEKK
jgi:hypothetical protein